MKKYIYPKYNHCDPLPQCEICGDGTLKLKINLRNVFHQLHLDNHGRPPCSGTNPYFDLYSQLLSDSEDVRFLEPGIADDTESKIGESRKLGRGFARGILDEHYQYTWFAKIQNLISIPYNGWVAKRTKNKGNTPDWLIANRNGDYAVAEAKGIHQKTAFHYQNFKKWRTQVSNIIIEHNGKKKEIKKTWIIATQFVKENQIDKPIVYIEDPPIKGDPINSDEAKTLIFWIFKSHVLDNLARLGLYRLIIKIQEGNKIDTKVRLMVWECFHPLLKGYKFVGSLSQAFTPYNFGLNEMIYLLRDERLMDRYNMLNNLYNGRQAFFEGIEVSVIKELLKNNIPVEFPEINNFDQLSFLSFMRDGSLIAPLDLMVPTDYIDF